MNFKLENNEIISINHSLNQNTEFIGHFNFYFNYVWYKIDQIHPKIHKRICEKFGFKDIHAEMAPPLNNNIKCYRITCLTKNLYECSVVESYLNP